MAQIYLGNPCVRGHSGERYVSTRHCVECQKLRSLKFGKEYKKIWRDKNRGIRNINGTSPVQFRLLDNAKRRASKKNIPYDLDRGWVRSRWTGKCELTNLPFDLSRKKKAIPFSPSIDKIKPNLGYTKENSRFILLGLNALKGTGTDDHMYDIARSLISAG